MKKILTICLFLLATGAIAGVFFSVNPSLGFSIYNDVYADGKKQVRAITDYGGQLNIEYGLDEGLRMGAVLGLLSMSVASDLGTTDANLFFVGLAPSFSFGFLDVIGKITGEIIFVFMGPTGSLSALGLSGTSNLEGRIYSGRFDVQFPLSEQFSVGAGLGVRFHDLYISTRNVYLRTLSTPIYLNMNYKF
ncbi:hypothetical protein [Pseudothermotoga elfii]